MTNGSPLCPMRLMALATFLCLLPAAAMASTFTSVPGAGPGTPMIAIGPTAPKVNKGSTTPTPSNDPDLQECLATVTKDATGIPDHDALDACINKKENEKRAAQEAADKAAELAEHNNQIEK